MQEEMQEKSYETLPKTENFRLEDLAAMLAASRKKLKKNECDGRAGNYLRLSDFD